MLGRLLVFCAIAGLAQVVVEAQQLNAQPGQVGTSPQWQTPIKPAVPAPNPMTPAIPESNPAGPVGSTSLTPTQFAGSAGVELPRQHGQLWHQYDISPYTSRVTNTEKPEQAVVDWILRETGTDVWFNEPIAILSANRTTLSVYHTPEMHSVVKEAVDRFVASQAESHVISMQLVTVGSPNWRSTAHSLLEPISVQTPGIDAWLLSKEDAAVLLGQLKKRSDFRDHNSPNLVIHNGQSHTISRKTPRSYVKGIRPSGGMWGGYDLEMGQFDEGYTLQMSPLFSLDASTVDGVIKCHVDQVERFIPIPVDVPGPGKRQRVQIQVPQVVSWRMHERFRWPASEVLLLSCGVVATPDSDRKSPLGISIPLLPKGDSNRADALLFIESKGTAEHVLIDARSATHDASNYNGRY